MWKKENLRKNFLRIRQIADQNLGRAEKSEVLSDELLSVEKRVDVVKTNSAVITKKISLCLQAQGVDIEKRLKKLPETSLAHSLIESAGLLGDETLLGQVCHMCGECESTLARERLQYEINVERDVLQPLQSINEVDIPAIMKVRRHLNKATLDMDSAKGRFNSAVRQSNMSGQNFTMAAAKADTIKDEYDEASNKVENIKDALAVEMSNFIAKETDHSSKLLALLEAQEAYHKKALEAIKTVIPKMKAAIDNCPTKPVYGMSLTEHLRVTGRDIAVVLEACIRTLLETAMEEEGLFRIAGGAMKLKKLKACFDANIVDMMEFSTEPHVVAGALKQYLRELPEPLLTFQLHSEFMQAAQLPQNQQLQAFWTVISKLPKQNYDNFRYLVKFLSLLCEKSEVNKMTPSNVAIVIGPNLLWSKGESAPNMLTTGTLSAIIEAVVMHADWFFPGDFDFHLTSRGSAPLPSKNDPRFHKTALTNQTASTPESKVVLLPEEKDIKMAPISTGEMDLDSQTLLQLSKIMADDPVVPLEDCATATVGNCDRASVSSTEGDRMLASSVRLDNRSNSIATTNTSLDINHLDISARSSTPSTPVSKSFYSDVYNTVFALQSLGDDSWNDYLTKVRAMWDGQFQTTPLREQNNHSEKSSRDAEDRLSALQEKQGQGQDFDFADVGESPLLHHYDNPLYESPTAATPTTNSVQQPPTSSSPQLSASPNASPSSSTSSTHTATDNTAGSSISVMSSSADNNREEQVSPKMLRRQTRKQAPPPPPDRPYSVAVTATVSTRPTVNQSSTWPRNAPLASPESPSEAGGEVQTLTERVKPLPSEKSHPHHDRPAGPPPEKPEKPERPMGPPPARPSIPPTNHQRSLSTGANINLTPAAAAQDSSSGQEQVLKTVKSEERLQES
ncbi:rho GTPase-activating protein 44-like isoform X2 [Gigantopelta aegis]|uniref:rho GTPase-activating protein 44-like isoform X2 n=1 Tax=Gigantopelta aegis TaxID=1735272 RepID=UPI001B88992A|nr:rho GTPase-activating protein 44-like isoform X2 [Gigantopelta aegis]